jgi:hypothetical protein
LERDVEELEEKAAAKLLENINFDRKSTNYDV